MWQRILRTRFRALSVGQAAIYCLTPSKIAWASLYPNPNHFWLDNNHYNTYHSYYYFYPRHDCARFQSHLDDLTLCLFMAARQVPPTEPTPVTVRSHPSLRRRRCPDWHPTTTANATQKANRNSASTKRPCIHIVVICNISGTCGATVADQAITDFVVSKEPHHVIQLENSPFSSLLPLLWQHPPWHSLQFLRSTVARSWRRRRKK